LVSWYYDDDNDGDDNAVIVIQSFGSNFNSTECLHQ